MERVMSVEDKIKKAEEIYYRKMRDKNINNNSARVSLSPKKKDYKIFKKLTIQVIVCLIIYFVFYFTINNNYIFSKDFTNKTKEILSYDIDVKKIYKNISNYINIVFEENKDLKEKNEKEEDKKEEEKIQVEENKEEVKHQEDESAENALVEENNKTEIIKEEVENIGGAQVENQQLSQMEKDCIDIKNITSFIVPVNGYISSPFGWRDVDIEKVSKNHMGLDIAAPTGTEIKAATNGKVILASTKGDYGNHLKIQLEDIVMIYAHCNVLCVNEGDYVTQGQKIAEVGSTGNSTGPHLHFEIRKSERFVNPQMILDI